MRKPKPDLQLPARLIAAAERFVDVQERRLERDLANDQAITMGLHRLAELLLHKLFEPRNK